MLLVYYILYSENQYWPSPWDYCQYPPEQNSIVAKQMWFGLTMAYPKIIAKCHRSQQNLLTCLYIHIIGPPYASNHNACSHAGCKVSSHVNYKSNCIMPWKVEVTPIPLQSCIWPIACSIAVLLQVPYTNEVFCSNNFYLTSVVEPPAESPILTRLRNCNYHML